MADILDFRPHEGKSARRLRSNAIASGCEIVIFPGVRYERWGSATPQEPKGCSSRKRVKRDTLELTD